VTRLVVVASAPTPSEPATLVLSERQRFLEARILAAVAVEFRRIVTSSDSWQVTDYMAQLHANARTLAVGDARRYITLIYFHLVWMRELPAGYPLLVFPGGPSR
jgi:hypothetical protein